MYMWWVAIILTSSIITVSAGRDVYEKIGK